jgi:hypothetical protein
MKERHSPNLIDSIARSMFHVALPFALGLCLGFLPLIASWALR